MSSAIEPALDLVQRLSACREQGARAPAPLQGLTAAVAALPARTLAEVDDHLRSNHLRQADDWYDLDPRELAAFARHPDAWGFVAVASCHPSGHVREAALRELGRRRDGRSVPFLVLRLNDWVAEVRRVAHFSLGRFLESRFAPALVAAVPLVVALERQRRADHGSVLAHIQGLLRGPDCQDAVLAGCASEDRDLRLACFRLAIAAEHADPASLLSLALADPHPAIRVWAVRALAADVSRPWAHGLALRALANPSVQVRRMALAAVAPLLPPEDLRRLSERALLDESVTTRWQARKLRLGLGAFDLVGFYRDALTRAPTAAALRGALLGLGESGRPDDIPSIRPYLATGLTSVRRAALHALGDLEPLTVTEPFLVALAGPEPGLSREGSRALEPRLAHVPPAALSAIVHSRNLPVHARCNAVSLASHLTKWDAATVLAEAVGSGEPEVAARGLPLLQGWLQRFNRSFLVPTHAQLDRLEQALARISGPSGRPEPRLLEGIVRHARSFAKR